MRLALAALLLVACGAPRPEPATHDTEPATHGTEPATHGTEPATRVPETVDWTAVASELAQRVELDQALRREIVESEEPPLELVHDLERVDGDNTGWIKALVTRHGWPTIERVGERGAGHAWLLVQHADHDVEFQERCLELLREAVAAGQAEPVHLAYLSDRVALHRGRPQRYGTQFVEKDGRLEPYELEDPARVDAWRAEVGLGTLADYAAILGGS